MDLLQQILNSVLVLLLGVAAVFDMKFKEISILIPIIGFTLGLTLQLIIGQMRILDLLGGCALGLFFILLAKFSREAIGYGDGLMLTATGIFLGLVGNIVLLLLALMLAAVFSLCVVLIKKVKFKSQIPFIPFMLGGYIVMLAFY